MLYETTPIMGIWKGADGASLVSSFLRCDAVSSAVNRDTSQIVLKIACTQVGDGRMGCMGCVDLSCHPEELYAEISPKMEGDLDVSKRAFSALAASLSTSSSSIFKAEAPSPAL